MLDFGFCGRVDSCSIEVKKILIDYLNRFISYFILVNMLCLFLIFFRTLGHLFKGKMLKTFEFGSFGGSIFVIDFLENIPLGHSDLP
jgi:hypothetical protein